MLCSAKCSYRENAHNILSVTLKEKVGKNLNIWHDPTSVLKNVGDRAPGFSRCANNDYLGRRIIDDLYFLI